jgi:hypothetical protein
MQFITTRPVTQFTDRGLRSHTEHDSAKVHLLHQVAIEVFHAALDRTVPVTAKKKLCFPPIGSRIFQNICRKSQEQILHLMPRERNPNKAENNITAKNLVLPIRFQIILQQLMPHRHKTLRTYSPQFHVKHQSM